MVNICSEAEQTCASDTVQTVFRPKKDYFNIILISGQNYLFSDSS